MVVTDRIDRVDRIDRTDRAAHARPTEPTRHPAPIAFRPTALLVLDEARALAPSATGRVATAVVDTTIDARARVLLTPGTDAEPVEVRLAALGPRAALVAALRAATRPATPTAAVAHATDPVGVS